MTAYLESLTSGRVPRSYSLGWVCHSEYPFLSLDQVTHQEKKSIYLDRLSTKTAIPNPVKGLLSRINRNFHRQGSFRNPSKILPRRNIRSNWATQRHWLFQDHSRGKPLQSTQCSASLIMHLNLVGANNDRLNIRSQLSVRRIDILRYFGVLHRDQLSSMRPLLIQKPPGISVVFFLSYAFHPSIAHRFGPKNAFFTVRLQSLLRIFQFQSVNSCSSDRNHHYAILRSSEFPEPLLGSVRSQPQRHLGIQRNISMY